MMAIRCMKRYERNDIDIAVFNQSVFAQDRYRLELFDLEDIYTLYDYPRAYGFLFKNRH